MYKLTEEHNVQRQSLFEENNHRMSLPEGVNLGHHIGEALSD